MANRKSVVFSGHRNLAINHVESIVQAVTSACDRASNVFLGGAAGFDTLALLRICDLIQFDKREVPHVWVVVPAVLAQQPQLSQCAVERAMRLCNDRFTLIEMGRSYNGESLKARNREMIDRAIELGDPELVCYFTGIWKSGTYSAMCYAKKKSVPITQIVS
jgi:hypothetical protein